jgi:cyanophycinase
VHKSHLRTIGNDEYNPYVNGICNVNSVVTLVIPTTTAANDPTVADIIRKAEAVFIAGGNQARYVNFWRGTRVPAGRDGDTTNASVLAG